MHNIHFNALCTAWKLNSKMEFSTVNNGILLIIYDFRDLSRNTMLVVYID